MIWTSGTGLGFHAQVRLDKVFARHNLDRKPAADLKANVALATQLYEIVTCAHSDRLNLEFDDNLRDERSEGEDEDELACLGVRPPSVFATSF